MFGPSSEKTGTDEEPNITMTFPQQTPVLTQIAPNKWLCHYVLTHNQTTVRRHIQVRASSSKQAAQKAGTRIARLLGLTPKQC